MTPLFARALESSLEACGMQRLGGLRGARLLVTGGTGFLGSWLLRAVGQLNASGFAIRLQCTSRDPGAFEAANPWAQALGIEWLRGDAASFAHLSIHAQTTHIAHLATSTDARANYADPLSAVRTVLAGTDACVQWARQTGAHLHFVSSGAVYGPRRASQGPAREDDAAGEGPDPLDPRQAYGNAKRMAESLVACGATDFCISRPFAFLGPGLPLDAHFAAGNFVRDALRGSPIRIAGDGTPLRSYMHPADWAAWTLALLASPARGLAVNIGSPEALSIARLAEAVSVRAGGVAVHVAGDPSGAGDPAAYWPDTQRAAGLGLRAAHGLDRCIDDTLAWGSSASPAGLEVQAA
jgi:nucleoside-diphosphate-sugar epimerase